MGPSMRIKSAPAASGAGVYGTSLIVTVENLFGDASPFGGDPLSSVLGPLTLSTSNWFLGISSAAMFIC